jgi:DNA-directed RNA polymerase subunit H
MEQNTQKINHFLVPEHTKLSEQEKTEFLNKCNIAVKQLPQIKSSDPAIKTLNVIVGDVIKIIRKSPTAGTTEFYRVVING